MRVLITGVGSDLGRAAARQMLAAGHDVAGVAGRRHRYLPLGVELVAGDPADTTALRRSVAGCDVVLHLAPLEAAAPEAAGIAGLAGVASCASDYGARLVLPVHAYGSGELYAQAEDIVRSSTVDHVLVRVAPLGGRQIDWQVARTAATLLSGPGSRELRLLHVDDLCRFLLLAVSCERTGVVDLAAPEPVSVSEARARLLGVEPKPDARGIAAWPRTPTLETDALAEGWGFACGWTGTEVVTDLAAGLTGRKLTRDGARSLLSRLPMPYESVPWHTPTDDTELVSAAPDGLEGEFDDRIDPRYPVFNATNTSEALPGPLTPMTLDVHLSGLRTANRALADMMAMEGQVAHEWESRVTAVFGHHVYLNVSVSVVCGNLLPGWDEDSLAKQALGGDHSDLDLHPLGKPPLPTGAKKAASTVTVLSRLFGIVRHYKAGARTYADAARRVESTREPLSGMSDARLDARIRLLRDRLYHGWTLSGMGVVFASVGATVLEKTGKGDAESLGMGSELESGRTFVEMAALAQRLRADEKLLDMAEQGRLDGIREEFPGFAAALDESVARIGHRGPGEAELANPVFADRPAMVLTTAAGAAKRAPRDETTREPRAKRSFAERLAVDGQTYRELARDATMRINHQLRLAVRELESRLCSAGRLTQVDDAFYLTVDELLTMPADTPDRVARRRTERERLQKVRLPEFIDGRWSAVEETTALPGGGELGGLGVSAGVAEGRVRILRSPEDADIEPDEVLVASVTDTGYTALFGVASAVVTDIGGTMSHAAIVAREFAVPCVVNTKTASTQLTDGMLVRVDGTAGTVTVLEAQPGPSDDHATGAQVIP